jgi:hypothetical protein
MRVFLFQSCPGLTPPSGGYKSNLVVLKHLASQGHTVQQMTFPDENDIVKFERDHVARTGVMPLVRRDKIHLPIKGENEVAELRISEFTWLDGIQIVGIDINDRINIFGGKGRYDQLCRQFTEVSKFNKISKARRVRVNRTNPTWHATG